MILKSLLFKKMKYVLVGFSAVALLLGSLSTARVFAFGNNVFVASARSNSPTPTPIPRYTYGTFESIDNLNSVKKSDPYNGSYRRNILDCTFDNFSRFCSENGYTLSLGREDFINLLVNAWNCTASSEYNIYGGNVLNYFLDRFKCNTFISSYSSQRAVLNFVFIPFAPSSVELNKSGSVNFSSSSVPWVLTFNYNNSSGGGSLCGISVNPSFNSSVQYFAWSSGNSSDPYSTGVFVASQTPVNSKSVYDTIHNGYEATGDRGNVGYVLHLQMVFDFQYQNLWTWSCQILSRPNYQLSWGWDGNYQIIARDYFTNVGYFDRTSAPACDFSVPLCISYHFYHLQNGLVLNNYDQGNYTHGYNATIQYNGFNSFNFGIDSLTSEIEALYIPEPLYPSPTPILSIYPTITPTPMPLAWDSDIDSFSDGDVLGFLENWSNKLAQIPVLFTGAMFCSKVIGYIFHYFDWASFLLFVPMIAFLAFLIGRARS